MTPPEGWIVEPLQKVADLTMGQSPDSKYYSEEEVGLPFLQGCAEFAARFPQHALYCSQAKKIAAPGSILFSVRAPVGRLNIADREYIIGRGLAAIRGTLVDQSYLEHYLRYEEPRFRVASQGSTFEAINSSELARWSIVRPQDSDEQAKIADVLSRVDRAIEQTEALIAKQQRIKTGLMQDLLTRGIDEHGTLRSEETHKFKASVLGRIPSKWNVRLLKQVSHEVIDCPHTTPRFVQGGVFVVRTFNAKGGRIIGPRSFVSERDYAERVSRLEPQAGDVILTREAPVGEAFVVPDGLRVCLGQRIMVIRCDQHECLPDFLVEVIYSERMRSRFDQMVGGTTNPHLNVGDVRHLRLALPPIAEQGSIRDTLAAMRAAIESELNLLVKLQRLKTGLMQDLLTGERRVTALLQERKALTA